MKSIYVFIACLLSSALVFAGVQVYNGTTNLGTMSRITCGTGTTCVKTFNDQATLNLGGSPTFSTLNVSGSAVFTGGISAAYMNAGPQVATWQTPTLTSGTSVTPSATTVYLSDVFVPLNELLTGIAVNNAGTCGTNKYVVALFNSFGSVLATSNLAGVLCSGSSAWQKIPFTAPINTVGPANYWVGVYMNGTTDRFYAIPAVGAFAGYTGTITGQTFGTVVAITPPTSFTADVGPIAYVY